MKKKLLSLIFLLPAFSFFCQTNSVSKDGTVFQSRSEIGNIKDIHISVVRTKTYSNDAHSMLVLEYKPKKTVVNGIKTNVHGLNSVDDMLTALKSFSLNLNAFDTATDFIKLNTHGIEVTYKKIPFNPKNATTTVAAQKFYIQTAGKVYEGKTVYQDEKGSYIWKQPATGNNLSNPLAFYLQVEKNVSASLIMLNEEEFKLFIQMIENAKAKM